MNQKITTAGVVFGGLIAIGVANRLGVSHDLIEAGAGLLIVIAGSLRSMFLGEVKS